MADREDGTPVLHLNGHDAQQSMPLIPASPRLSSTQHQRDSSQSRLLPTTPCDTAFSHSPQISADPQKSQLQTEKSQERGSRVRHFWSSTSLLAACLCVMALILTSIMVPPILVDVTTYYNPYDEGICDSAGNFYMYFGPSFWAPSRAFEITLAFGNFSFSNAKLMDIMWDVVIGRGGQALLTFISYRVFSQCLTRLMEQSSVTISAFESISLRGSTSIVSIFLLIKDFLANTTTRARFCMGWVIFASLYVLFFQTLLSAMTGYVAKNTPYLEVSGGGQQPWSLVTEVSFIIHDAWRLGLSGDYILTDANTPYSSCFQIWSGFWSDYSGLPEECQILLSTFNYVEALGGSPSNRTSTFVNPKNDSLTIYLEAPTLNISIFSGWMTWLVYGHSLGAFDVPTLYTLIDRSPNATFSFEYVQEHSSCNPEKTYQWGFSGLLLFFAIVLTTFWAIGMLLMWLDARFQSKLNRYGREQGSYRAALDFAMVLTSELNSAGDINMLSDKAIRRRMKKDKRIATICYTDLVAEKATVNRAIPSIDIIALLATALVFSIIELGLCAYVLSFPSAGVFSSYWIWNYALFSISPSPLFSFLFFASIWTLLITAFRIVFPLLRAHSTPDRPATTVMTLVVNAVTMIFWLAVFAALEKPLGGHGASGLGALIMAFALLLCLVFLVLLVLNVCTALGIVKSDRMGYSTLVKKD